MRKVRRWFPRERFALAARQSSRIPLKGITMTETTDKVQPQPQPQQPPRRPPDIVVPMGQPLPKGPGIEWWIKKIGGRK
jgi:hypothetical protein